MSAGSLQMQELLYNDSGTQTSVSTFTITTTEYMIFEGSLLPEFILDDTGRVEIDVKKKTLNHFAVTPENGNHEVIDITRQVSCRAYTEAEAEAIQLAAFTVLNRVKSTDGSVAFIAEKMPTIAPQDKADNWNAPLNVRTMTTI